MLGGTSPTVSVQTPIYAYYTAGQSGQILVRAPQVLGQLSLLGAPLLPSSLQYCPLLASLQIKASELKGLEPNSNQETLTSEKRNEAHRSEVTCPTSHSR